MELEEQISNRYWTIPHPGISEVRGLCAVSHGINGVVVFPSPYPRSAMSSKTTASQCQDGTDTLKLLVPHTWLFSRHTRQLINEAMGTFRSLQLAVEEAASSRMDGASTEGEVDLTPLLVKKSREYRSMLQACVCSLNASLDKEDPGSDEYQQMAGQCQLLYKMELLLGLTEIIFIDARPGSLILSQLVCWVRLHYTTCTEQMVQVMAEESPADHPLYWEAIYSLTCQGRLSDARQMLQQHPHAHTDDFTAMEEMLRKMPTYQVFSGVSEGEFMLRWQHWQAECENRQRRGDFAAWSHLKKLAEILCGNTTTILSVTSLPPPSSSTSPPTSEGECWVPHLLATLLYTQPNVKPHRLHAAALQAMTECRERGGGLDALLLAAMEGDAMQVVRGCQQALDNLWMSAHLTDLLHHALQAQRHTQQSLSAMRESIVQEYALDLVDHPSLWQVGVVYLDYCGSGVPSPLVPLVLERVPLTSDDKAHRVINMAVQRGLDSVVWSVCRVMGRLASSEGRLAAAIWWGVRARDAPFTAQAAHQVLHRYLSSGEFQSSALLLDHLGPSMLLSDTLTFLGKYREFHSLYLKGELRQAAELLVTLIASKLAPQYFWPVLLLDALPLLQQCDDAPEERSDEGAHASEVVVSSDNTYELMYCLNTVVEQLQNGEQANDSSPLARSGLLRAFLQREDELRRCLTHNLARAIVAEGSGGGMEVGA